MAMLEEGVVGAAQQIAEPADAALDREKAQLRGCRSSTPLKSRLAIMVKFEEGATVMNTSAGAPFPGSSGTFRSCLPDAMWRLTGRPASCTASQSGSQWGSHSSGQPRVSGALGKESALWPSVTPRWNSLMAAGRSQKGTIVWPMRRLGLVAHQVSATQSL